MKKDTTNAKDPGAQDKKGLIQEVGQAVKDNLNITPATVTQALIKDAEQAVNYEIRKGLRGFINGLFKR